MMAHKTKTCVTGTLLCVAFIASSANADVPKILHYQGVLSDIEGNPVHCLNDGSCTDTYSMTFRLYAEVDGGDALFEQAESNVEISNGVFEVTLGSPTPITLAVVAGADLFLGLSINEGTELMPRLRVASSAFALKAQHAVSATTADKASDADTVGGFSPEDFLTPAEVDELLEDKGFCTAPCYGDSDVADYLSENGYSPGPYYTDLDVENYLNENNIGPGLDAVVDLLPVEPGPDCPAGGVQVLSGYDADESGTLAGDEITNAAYVCDGVPGTDGAKGDDGAEGVGVVSATVNNAGQLEIVLSDGTTSLSASLIGPPGSDGALTGLSCQTGDIIKLGDDGWECAQDENTTYSGQDFALSGQGCSSGFVVSAIDGTGAVTCVPDADTQMSYTASSGVALVGTDFRLDSTGCGTGHVLKWTGSGWACLLDTDSTYTAGDGLVLNGSTFSVNASGCTSGDVLKRTPDGAAWYCASDDVGISEYTASQGVTLVGNDIRLDSSDCSSGQVLKWTGSDWDCVDDANTTYDGTDFALSNQGCASDEYMVGVDANGLVICEEYVDRSLIPVVSDSLSEGTTSTGAFNFTDLAIGATSPNAGVTFNTVLPEPARANAVNGIQAGTANIVSSRFGSGGAADTQINIDLTSRIPHDLITANATVFIDELELGKTGTKSWYNVFILDVDPSGVAGGELYLNTSPWSTSKTVNPNISFKPKVGHRYVIRVIMSCFSTTQCADALTTVRVAGRWETGLQNRVTGECAAAGLAIKSINEDGTVECETGLQRRVVGSCSPGSSIRSIAANGSVTCETDDSGGTTLIAGPGLTIVGDTIQVDNSSTITVNSLNISTRTRWRHVHVADFQRTGTDTQSNYALATSADYMMFSGATTFVAPVDLPEGVTISELRCYLYDSDGFNSISVNASLRRRGYTNTWWTSVASVSFGTGAQSALTTIQSQGDNASHVVNNEANAYSLTASISATTATSINLGLRFYGCRIKYTQSSL